MQIAGLLSIFLILLMCFAVVKAHPQGKATSISQHAAHKTWTYIIFGTILTLFGGYFLVYLQNSFYPLIQTPKIYLVFMPIAWILLLITAWVPSNKNGQTRKIHQIAAIGVAIMMTVFMSSLVFAGHIFFLFRIIGALISLWYIYNLYLLFFVKKSREHFLVYQTINIISFFGAIIIVDIFQTLIR